jgi:N-acetylmuramoyl-L-alanine amidase
LKKKDTKFLYTFFLLLTILIFLVVVNINKNILSILDGRNKYATENTVDENAAPTNSVSTNDLDSSVDVDSSSIETKMILANKTNQRTIVIDPGHGGPDPGSSGKKGTQEKQITLEVALKLGTILEKQGYKIIYTRKTDKIQWSGQKQELLERATISNNANADLFISIHTNASKLSNISGIETYYNKVSSKGKKAAQLVQAEVVKQVKLRNRGIKTEDYSVLRNVTAPSVLIELAYISTPSDEDILKNSQYQAKFAQGIANGINKYFEK